MMISGAQKFVRITEGLLLLVVAINAFAGGFYGMTGAKDVPLEWLEGSPFKSYLIPGIILYTVVGGSCLYSGIAVLRQLPVSRIGARLAGIIILIWIGAQLSIIGYVNWMQPAIALTGIAILLLAYGLPAPGKHPQ